MSINHYQNVVTLLEQYLRLQNKKNEYECMLQSEQATLENIDHIEHIEEELAHIISYSRTLIDQATVIINENDVKNVPTLEQLSMRLLV